MNYTTHEENLRTIETDTVTYRLEMDGRGLWSISTNTGQTPVSLRGQYTTAQNAALGVQNYLNDAPRRQAAYKKVKE